MGRRARPPLVVQKVPGPGCEVDDCTPSAPVFELQKDRTGAGRPSFLQGARYTFTHLLVDTGLARALALNVDLALVWVCARRLFLVLRLQLNKRVAVSF